MKDSSLLSAVQKLVSYCDHIPQFKFSEELKNVKSALSAYDNTPDELGEGDERNFDIDVLLSWIANRIEEEELSAQMNELVKDHKFEEATEVRNERIAVNKTLHELRITVGELLDKYQYYFRQDKINQSRLPANQPQAAEGLHQTPVSGWSDKLKDTLDKLYEEVAHGDDEHRKWLKDKFDDFVKRNS